MEATRNTRPNAAASQLDLISASETFLQVHTSFIFVTGSFPVTESEVRLLKTSNLNNVGPKILPWDIPNETVRGPFTIFLILSHGLCSDK